MMGWAVAAESRNHMDMGVGNDLAGFTPIIDLHQDGWRAGNGFHADRQPGEVPAEFGQNLRRKLR